MEEEEMDGTLKNSKLRCTEVPKDLLTRSAAKRHFEQYGRIVRLILKPRSRSCIVEYDSFDTAQVALLNAGEYMNHVFTVNWYEKPAKVKRAKKEQDPDWVLDPEVMAEIAAMASFENGSDFNKTYNLRSEGMAVDPFSEPKVSIKKVKGRKSDTHQKKTKTKPSPGMWKPEQLELVKILRQPANTVEEKFKVLDARDKLIRLCTKRDTDLTKTTHRVGICPDMCPEKERLLREMQHQVAVYEQDWSGRGMNPALAVKQYSRSSADQEVPLLHELRPVSVLQLTMEYLMHRIMNLCDTPDVNLMEWYHFLWDRTRGIRKDITQQELCCQGSVALLEQCARFHIHCSARLVAEDLSVFDQRINTENLTKCLQTLKYMYHDLSVKGESCPNEAEFRAYVILLNLNDGNFMWEVQQLKQAIQKSPEIKFALEVYSAIDKNNFVKFFKLVRTTNYLNACILLRYFVQVRTKALSAVLKCYSPRSPYTLFSLTELGQLLAFEDVDSVRDFIVSYGLYFNQENTHVILDRKSFQLPETPYLLDRAIGVVESKRNSSVGEVVYGGHLPPPKFDSYVPSDSFDQNGLFVVDETTGDIFKGLGDETDSAHQKRDQSPKPAATNIFIPKEAHQVTEVHDVLTSRPPPQADRPNISVPKAPLGGGNQTKIFDLKPTNENRFKITNPAAPFWSIREPPPPASVFKLGGGRAEVPMGGKTVPKNIFGAPVVNEPPIFQQQHQNMFEPVPLSTPINFFGPKPAEAPPLQVGFGLPNVGQNWFLKSSAAETAKGAETMKSFVPVPRSPIKSPQFDQKQQLEAARFLELERQQRLLQEREEQLKREMEEARAQATLQKKRLEEERRRKEEERIKMERRRRLEEERQRVLQIERERKLAQEIRKSVAQLVEDLLAQVEEDQKQERLEEIRLSIRNRKALLFFRKWVGRVALNKRKREAMDQNPVWLPSRDITQEARELFTDTQILTLENIKRYKAGKPIEIELPIENPSLTLNIAKLYKVLLTSYSRICHRLPKEIFWKVTVSLPDFQEVKHGLNYVEDVLTDFFGWQDRYGTTSLVEQYVSDHHFSYCIEKKQGVLTTEGNSNGLLFIAQEPFEPLAARLTSALKNLSHSSNVPVFVVLLQHDSAVRPLDQRLEEILEMTECISRYSRTTCKLRDAEIAAAIERGLIFLAESVDKPPPLELNMLRNLMLSHVAAEPWERMKTYAAWNSKYKSCLKSPGLVINLYNEAVERLKEIVSDEYSLTYQNFPDEFDKLLMEQVPEILPCDYKYFPSFWKSKSYQKLLVNTVGALRLPQYNGTWPPDNEANLERDILAYCSRVFRQPRVVFYKVMAVILRGIDPVKDFERIRDILWIDVIEVIASELIQQTDFLLHHTEFHTKSIFEQLFAVYNVKSLTTHGNDEWFYLGNPSVEAEMNQNMRRKKVKSKSLEHVSLPYIDLDELERSVWQESTVDLNRSMSSIAEIKTTVADLEESMEIHKRICSNFQKNVKKILDV